MKRSAKILIAAAAVMMFLAVLAGTAFAAFAYVNTREMKAVIEKNFSEEVDPAREDDVCIADDYYIRSTLPISEAYISGDTSALNDREKETLKMASDILEGVIEEGMTPFEKEEAVYLWLTTKLAPEAGLLTVIPTTGEDADNPYGVLKNRSAVCVGYATTFRLFMQMMGIECKVVHDTSLSHSWDLVKLDDEWYHTDCYFDSEDGNYYYFNLSDEVMGRDHDWNHSFFPKAEGKKYNHALMNAVELDDITDVPAFAKENMDKEKCFACRFKGGVTPEMEPAAHYMIETLSEAINSSMEGSFSYYWAKDANDDYVLCMFYGNDGSSDPSEGVSEEMMERINEAISSEFDFYYDY